MLVVGVTGEIAAGKTVVIEVARDLSQFKVVDADKLAWESYEPGRPAYWRIIDYFGSGILTDDGRIDRNRLGKMVFSDPRKRKVLESFVHPEVVRSIQREARTAARNNKKILVVEAALIFQSDYVNTDTFDCIVLVVADRQTRLERLMNRNDITVEQAERRIDVQSLSEEAERKADFVICAQGSIERTKQQANKVFRKILREV